MSKKLFVPYSFLCLICAFVLFSFPDAVKASTTHSLHRCAESIIPSFFPMMVLSRQIYGNIAFGKNVFFDAISSFTGFREKLLPIFFTGLLCGYPVPSAICKKAYDDGALSKKEAELASLLCNNASPSFVILLVGKGVFGDITTGVVLYVLQTFSVICAAHIFCRKDKESFSYGLIKKESLAESVSEAVTGILKVCGFVIFFSLFSDAIRKLSLYIGAPSVLRIFLTGMTEVTGAVFELSALSWFLKAILACAFCAFGGISVYFQISAIMKTDILSYIKVRGTVFLLMSATFLAVLKIFELMSLL